MTNIIADDVDHASATLSVVDAYGNALQDLVAGLTILNDSPQGDGDMGITFARAQATDNRGTARGWVKASTRAGSVEVGVAVLIDGTWLPFGQTHTIEFVEPTFKILADIDYLPAGLQLSFTNNSTQTSQPSGDAGAPITVFGAVSRHSTYLVDMVGATDALCGFQGDNQGVMPNDDVTIGISCADKWLEVSASKVGDFNAAIRKDGTLWAWGNNDYGQLGDGTTTSRTKPVQVGTRTNWTDVSLGKFHVLALDADQKLWSWGDNTLGQLGYSTTLTTQKTPAEVALPAGSSGAWHRIAAGADHSVATVKAAREDIPPQLYIWGRQASTSIKITTPALQPLEGCRTHGAGMGCREPDRIDWLAAGENYSVFIGHLPFVSGGVSERVGVAWGHWKNNSGQLGLGDLVSRDTPDYRYDFSWWKVDAGQLSTIGITELERHLYIWGARYGAQTLVFEPSPRLISGTRRWKQASAGKKHFVAIREEDDELVYWGEAIYGELGGAGGFRRTEVPVYIGLRAAQSAAGNGVSYYIDLDSGELFAQGHNKEGKLGIAKTYEAPDNVVMATSFTLVKTNP